LQVIVGSAIGDDITSTIKALQDFGDTEILSTPHIAVMNNEEARILVGRREAYVTSTTTQAQTTATTAESVQFVDVGVKLYVTPTISENGFVTLKIRPEVSTKVDTLTTPSKNIIPIVETSEAETRVMVKDGKTIVIGGLMKEETTLTKQKVPLLGDIPILKVLFSNRSDRIKKTELVILLTPHIITGEEYFAPSSSVTADGHPSTTHTVRP
jgi:type II secretory pathway component GspD/PulD (secretin)